ncbi:MAG: hypothetical protein M3512_15580 [Bacteroidota bacterium]|nr:hypothetical protein [Bacteroidota bacterium]
MIIDYEIIVSFSTSDNLPGPSGKGWVSLFQQYLKATIAQLTGKEPEVTLHSENDYISSAHYKVNTIIVLVITPDYIKSGLLESELRAFSTIDIGKEDATERMFMAMKFPLEESKLHESIRNIIQYPFYKKSTPKYSDNNEEWNSELCLMMLDLTYSIQKKIEILHNSKYGLNANSGKPLKKVYLAYTANDLLVHREIIHRELVRQNILVKPDTTLPEDILDIEHVIRKDMEDCELSIHLIGEDYGDIPKGADRSLVDIQNKIAVEISSNPFRDKLNDTKRFSRYVWITPELNKVVEKQKLFIENIKRDIRALREDEILQVPFDELKEIIQNKIIFSQNNIDKIFSFTSYDPKGKGTVYLIYETIDMHLSNEIAAYLEVEGYDVIFSDFSGDQLSVRKKHQDNLRTCDAPLIICGDVNLEWINIKLQDIVKAPGFGRTKPFKTKALYIDYEKYLKYHQRLLNLNESIILEISSNFIPDNFFRFLNKITA